MLKAMILRKKLFASLAVLLIPSCASFDEEINIIGKEDPIDEMSLRFLQSCVSESLTPGGAMMTFDSRGHQRFFTAGFQDIEAGREYTPQTRTTLHSISKVFVGVVAAQLADEGKLNLDLPVANYIPELSIEQGAEQKITVRMLLSHTSGLPLENEDVYSNRGDAFGPELIKLKFEPGATGARSYSNTAFAIAALVIEAIEQKDLSRVYKERIFGPLDMSSTVFGSDPNDSSLASQYMPERYWLPHNSNAEFVRLQRPASEHAAFAVTSTLEDLAKFGRALMELETGPNPILSPTANRLIRQTIAPGESYDQALGIRILNITGGQTLFGHSGTWAGGRTALYLSESTGRGVAVFVNTAHRCNAAELAEQWHVSAQLLDEDPNAQSEYVSGSRDVSILSEVQNAIEYAGVYTASDSSQVVLTADQNSLFLELGGSTIKLEHIFDEGDDAFVYAEEAPARFPLRFSRGAERDVISLSIGPKSYRKGERAPLSVPKNEDYCALEGHYRNSRAAPPGFDIYQRDGRLFRRSYWWDGEVELVPNGRSPSGRFVFSFGEADGKNYIEFEPRAGDIAFAYFNRAPFEKTRISPEDWTGGKLCQIQ